MTAAQPPGPVLLVEDDAAFCDAIAMSLRLAGHEVAVHADAADALASIDARFAGVVVSDLRMPGMDGWQFFEGLQAIDADLPVIFMTGHGNIDEAVSALKQGAYDFMAKPFAPPRLLASIARAIEKRRLVLDNRRLRTAAASLGDAGDRFSTLLPLAGDSPAMTALRATLMHLGEADIDVLIEAEPGTGRDRVARLLHDASSRRSRPFTSINCAAAQPDLLGAELFGEAPGAGGTSRHAMGRGTGRETGRAMGRLALADRGTLFLDAADMLPGAMQIRLLATLDSGELMPLRSNMAQPLDVRVIAAADGDLAQAVADGRFRPELLMRLGALRLRIPPLRERREDVPLLFGRLAAEAAQRFGQPLPTISTDVRAHLLGHDWPGNLRELAQFAERFVLGLAPEPEAGSEKPGSGTSLTERMARIEAGLLRDALSTTGGQISEAVRLLGLPRKTLYDKLTRHGIDPASYRKRAAGRQGGSSAPAP